VTAQKTATSLNLQAKYTFYKLFFISLYIQHKR